MDDDLLGLLIILGITLAALVYWLVDEIKVRGKKPDPKWVSPKRKTQLDWELERFAKSAENAGRKEWGPTGPSEEAIAPHRKQGVLRPAIRWAKPRLMVLAAWGVLVFTYFLLIRPYGDISRMDDDEWLHFWLWVFLPPLVVDFVGKTAKKLLANAQ